MSKIRAFRAIRPNPSYAEQLILNKSQAQAIAGNTVANGLPPLKNLLETAARIRPETSEGQAGAFAGIDSALETLLADGKLILDDDPAIYVYEIEHPSYRQTGVWALSELSDYTNGTIKTHELTFGDSVRRLKNYRQHTGLEGNPILLTYHPDRAIDRIIAQAKSGVHSTLGNQLGIHRLWKIKQREIQQELIEAFAKIEISYLADGHHRLESAVQLAAEQQLTGEGVYDTISSLYMSAEDLKIQEYDRLVIPEKIIESTAFFEGLIPHFFLREASPGRAVRPGKPRRFGMYLKGIWYHLLAKPHTYTGKSVAGAICASILQDYVLAPLFGINDPKDDRRLKCLGGEGALEEMELIMEKHPEGIVFTLCPVGVNELIAVANAGDILPPKSTWIDPKVPFGLLINHHKSTIDETT